mgnify:CR=1 FL=1
MLHTLTLEFMDNEGSMPVTCVLYDDITNTDVHKMYTYPNLMDEICDYYNCSIMLAEGTFKYGNTTKEMIAPICIPNDDTDMQQIKNSEELQSLLFQPDTVINTIIQNKSENDDILLDLLYDSFIFIQKTKRSTKVIISKEHFLDEELANIMITNRPTFKISSDKNVDIFQKTPTDTICFELPSIYTIQESSSCTDTLDLLYLTAPYRKQTRISNMYMSIFHTPFFRHTRDIDKVYSQNALNSVDSDFKWLYGIAKNNMLPIQPNELQLFQNLETLYFEDITLHLEDLIAGIFFNSNTGRKLQKLEGLSKNDFIACMQVFLNELSPYVSCSLTMEDLFDLDDSIIVTKQTLLNLFNGTIKINHNGVMQMIEEMKTANHIIDCNSFVITPIWENLNDIEITQALIDNGFISKHMYDYLIELCMIAYRINWGHTATTKAIPGLISKDKLQAFDNKMMDKLNSFYTGKNNSNKDIFSSFVNDDSDDDNDNIEDIEARFNQYLSDVTIAKIKNSPDGLLLIDDPTTQSILSPKERLIERWREINGESRLSNFINKGFTLYHDYKILITAFIKLLRWGEERKPTMLVFPEYPDIQTVYDLNESVELQNIYIVNEKDLILKNGCRYSLIAPLYTEEPILNIKEPILVGFLLAEDYGKIQKYYVASWSDMCSLVNNEKCDIENLKLQSTDLTQMFVSDTIILEKDLTNIEYDFIVTEDKIKDSVTLNCQASSLSDCILLFEQNITKSSEFIKSTTRTAILSLRDKQYDILHNYIRKLISFYNTNSNKITTLKNTCLAVQLIELINIWSELDNNNIVEKPHHNEVVGDNILNKLELNTQKDTVSKMAYNSFTDISKVALIVDKNMISGLDPIIFENNTLAAISKMLQNKLVLCMGYTNIQGKEYRIFFKDKTLQPNSLQLKTNENTGKKSPIIYDYSSIEKIINHLKGSGFVQSNDTGYLCDSSLKGII